LSRAAFGNSSVTGADFGFALRGTYRQDRGLDYRPRSREKAQEAQRGKAATETRRAELREALIGRTSSFQTGPPGTRPSEIARSLRAISTIAVQRTQKGENQKVMMGQTASQRQSFTTTRNARTGRPCWPQSARRTTQPSRLVAPTGTRKLALSVARPCGSILTSLADS